MSQVFAYVSLCHSAGTATDHRGWTEQQPPGCCHGDDADQFLLNHYIISPLLFEGIVLSGDYNQLMSDKLSRVTCSSNVPSLISRDTTILIKVIQRIKMHPAQLIYIQIDRLESQRSLTGSLLI